MPTKQITNRQSPITNHQGRADSNFKGLVLHESHVVDACACALGEKYIMAADVLASTL
jgi:hypothetical protein